MNQQQIKALPTLGCCGLDCGLCPTYNTEANSRCPGCGGLGFSEKHPSCAFITCCVKKKGLEVCALCSEYPCSRFKGWEPEGENVYDSFLTHKKAMPNQNFIREHGLDEFLEQQKKRIEMLEVMLNNFNEGRSKSFYCLATALLPIPGIEVALTRSHARITTEKAGTVKTHALILRELLAKAAGRAGIELKLRRKG